MTKQFYAIGNRYASGTSGGFLNTDFVRIFDTAAARDRWLGESMKAVRACTKSEAIAAIQGNHTCVGKSCSRDAAWREIVEDNDSIAVFED